MSVQFRLLTEDEVRTLVSAPDLVPCMQTALAAFSQGEVVQPPRTTLWVGEQRDFFGLMPAHLPARGALGTKLITLFAGNRARGLPSHFATILLLDACTGALLAIMDGGYITEVRTAAVSAVAIHHLALCPVSTMALFGCGVQAHGHLKALAALFPSLRDVRVWSPYDERRAFVEEMSATVRPSVREAASGEDAARDADLIVTVTSSPTPVVESDWVKPGALVVAVGACRPEHRELDPLLLVRSRLVVDSRDTALTESGDVIQGMAEGRIDAGHVRAELGEIIAGRTQARADPADVVIFKSLGLAVEDVAASELVYRRALERGVGTSLSL
jgi:alanine dehydrogenase